MWFLALSKSSGHEATFELGELGPCLGRNDRIDITGRASFSVSSLAAIDQHERNRGTNHHEIPALGFGYITENTQGMDGFSIEQHVPGSIQLDIAQIPVLPSPVHARHRHGEVRRKQAADGPRDLRSLRRGKQFVAQTGGAK